MREFSDRSDKEASDNHFWVTFWSLSERTKPSHSQSLADFVANVHSQGISAARMKFLQFHSQNDSHSIANPFAMRNSQLLV